MYKAVKENDGTYTIRHSKLGLNWEIVLAGVRGCNVNRTINKLRAGVLTDKLRSLERLAEEVEEHCKRQISQIIPEALTPEDYR